MRVLQIHNRYRHPGGEDAVVEAEAELLQSAGHEVIRYRTENPSSAIPATGALALSFWNPFSARHLDRLLTSERPDVAHVHNTWYALSPSIIRTLERAGVPLVLTLHNYRLLCTNALLFRDGRPCEDCVGTHPWHGVVHRCYRDSVVPSAAAAVTIASNRSFGTWERGVDLYLALTHFARERFIAGGLPAQKISVKPNFVPDPGRRPEPPSSSKTILYVGRLSPEKGLDTLLQAWAGLEHGGYNLQIVGEGPLESELARRIGSTEVEMLGQLAKEEVIARMLEARALVFPSVWYEGCPMVILEAFAAGLPVVASDLGSMSELVRPLGSRWLATAGDVTAWQARLEQLHDDEHVDGGSQQVRELYEERYGKETALSNLVTAYETVLGG